VAYGVERKMFRGDTLAFQVQVFQSPPFNTVPQNLTGWTLWFTVKFNTQDPDNIAVFQGTNLTNPPGVTINNYAQGLATPSMPPVSTRGFPDGVTSLFYDVQAMDPSGNIYTVEAGTVDVLPDVTNNIGSPVVPIPPVISPIPTIGIVPNGGTYNMLVSDSLIEWNGAAGNAVLNVATLTKNQSFTVINTSSDGVHTLTINAPAPFLIGSYTNPGTYASSTTFLGQGAVQEWTFDGTQLVLTS
jgi:hypothetical protein